MAFWSTGQTEPKRNFRFQVQITGLADQGAPSDIIWWAKSVTTPSFEVSSTEHDYLDNKYYFPGRVTWNDVTLTMVDPISVDAVKLTNKLLVSSGYTVKTSQTDIKTMSKKQAIDTAIKDIKIMIYDAAHTGGAPIETWTLNNAFITTAKYGDLDYSSDDLRTVEITVKYDWATCEQQGTESQFKFGSS